MYHVQGPCQDEKSVCPLNESWADLEPPARACLSVVSCPSSPLSPESALVNASPHDHARRHSPMRLPYFGGHISDSCAGCIHRPTRFASRLCGCDGTAVAFFLALLHGRQESSREATREENELMKAKAPKVFAVMCTQRDQVGGRSARGVGITLFSFLFLAISCPNGSSGPGVLFLYLRWWPSICRHRSFRVFRVSVFLASIVLRVWPEEAPVLASSKTSDAFQSQGSPEESVRRTRMDRNVKPPEF